MRIFGWLADHAGCGWYRMVMPLGALSELGHQTDAAGRMPEDALERYDIIIGQRVFKPPPSSRWQSYAALPNRPLMVYEVDDDLLNVPEGNPAAHVFNRAGIRDLIEQNIRVADLVTCSTEPLAEVLRKINPNVVVLPNCIPADMLAWQHGGYQDRVTVGWQGSPTHDRDWAPISQTIGAWFRAQQRLAPERRPEMHTIGALPASFPQRLPRHRHTPWTQSIPQYYISIDWDVALAPLEDSVFNRSKSDIRIVEAAMLGIPVVASNVPAYHTIGPDVGFLVNSAKQWKDALTRLVYEPDLRQHMSAAARAHAATRTIEANAHRWDSAYKEAMR